MKNSNVTVLKPAPKRRVDVTTKRAVMFSEILDELAKDFKDGKVLQVSISCHSIDEIDGAEKETTQYTWFSEANSNAQLLVGVGEELRQAIIQKELDR